MQKYVVKLENGKTMTVTKTGNKEALVLRDENNNVLEAKVVNHLIKTKQI